MWHQLLADLYFSFFFKENVARANGLDRAFRILQFPSRDLQGQFQLGILLLEQKEFVRPNCMFELQRNQVSELHFDKMLDLPAIQCWKTSFETEVCSCSSCLSDAMLWIKEVEVPSRWTIL